MAEPQIYYAGEPVEVLYGTIADDGVPMAVVKGKEDPDGNLSIEPVIVDTSEGVLRAEGGLPAIAEVVEEAPDIPEEILRQRQPQACHALRDMLGELEYENDDRVFRVGGRCQYLHVHLDTDEGWRKFRFKLLDERVGQSEVPEILEELEDD